MQLHNICEVKYFDILWIYFMVPFPASNGNKFTIVSVDYISKWVKIVTLPINDNKVVLLFLKKESYLN